MVFAGPGTSYVDTIERVRSTPSEEMRARGNEYMCSEVIRSRADRLPGEEPGTLVGNLVVRSCNDSADRRQRRRWHPERDPTQVRVSRGGRSARRNSPD